ncbi:hypothetical protein D9M69_552480 [compost metagenome]
MASPRGMFLSGLMTSSPAVVSPCQASLEKRVPTWVTPRARMIPMPPITVAVHWLSRLIIAVGLARNIFEKLADITSELA